MPFKVRQKFQIFLLLKERKFFLIILVYIIIITVRQKKFNVIHQIEKENVPDMFSQLLIYLQTVIQTFSVSFKEEKKEQKYKLNG